MNLAWAVFGTFFMLNEGASLSVLIVWAAALVADLWWENRAARGK